MKKCLFLAATLVIVTVATAVPVRFDQRQNGSLNIQVDLKDLEVYAIVEDEMIEGAMDQISGDQNKPRPNASIISSESHKGIGDTGVSASSSTSPASSASNPHRRPNDKLSSIKQKNGAPLQERSDSLQFPEPSGQMEEIVKIRETNAKSAASRSDPESSDEDQDPDAEPRTSAVEARAASSSATRSASRPFPNHGSGREGLHPSGSVSVAHLHCGQGYYRDQNGKCRRSKRPATTTNVRKTNNNQQPSASQTSHQHQRPSNSGSIKAAASPSVSNTKPSVHTENLSSNKATTQVSPVKSSVVKPKLPLEPLPPSSESKKGAAQSHPTPVVVSGAEKVPLRVAPIQKDKVHSASKDSVKDTKPSKSEEHRVVKRPASAA